LSLFALDTHKGKEMRHSDAVAYKNTADRDNAIISSFQQMSTAEIEQLFCTAGGLYAEHCFSGRKAPYVAAERHDKWILEVRPSGDGGNNVWIKATTKTISDQERTWVLSWLESLGFDPAEAIIYFNSNIPRKRDIADRVGLVLTHQKVNPSKPVRSESPETRAANQVNSHIEALVAALHTSGRVNRCQAVQA
jgi:hypothetical protein